MPEPIPYCGGAGEIERGITRDYFGNWDTEVFPCHGCPECMEAPEAQAEREYYAELNREVDRARA